MADSTATFTGGLTRDPEIRYPASGTPVATFAVAVSKRTKRDGEWEEQTSFIDCVCFGSLAENVAASCSKGTRVTVFGSFEQRSWEDDSGEKRTKLQVIADDVAPSLRWATAVVEKNPKRA